MPAPVSSFVGREDELGVLERLIGDHRLVTVTGPGGAGKTRLAIEVAGRIAGAFPDGVWFIDLAQVDAAGDVGRAVASSLGVTDPSEVDGVATFYNLIFREPVGRKVIYLCTSVTCWMLGCDKLKGKIHDRLGIGPGETTADGEYTLLPITCLGDSDHAPALMIDKEHYGNVDDQQLEQLLAPEKKH